MSSLSEVVQRPPVRRALQVGGVVAVVAAAVAIALGTVVLVNQRQQISDLSARVDRLEALEDTAPEPAAGPPATEPATSEPATTEPATTEPATSEPGTSEPATSEQIPDGASRLEDAESRLERLEDSVYLLGLTSTKLVECVTATAFAPPEFPSVGTSEPRVCQVVPAP